MVELQHSSISAEDIAKREAHYGRGMVWLFDARRNFQREHLNLRRGDNGDYVKFQWKQARRSILECRRTVLLDLGQGLVLSVKKKYAGPPVRGWGHLFHTTDVWSWLRDGIPPTPIVWNGAEYRDLVERIIHAATYLRQSTGSTGSAGDSSAVLAADETSRIMKAMLFAGNEPRDEMRSALVDAHRGGIDLDQLHDHIGLRGRWDVPGQLTVLCWCGATHRFQVGPTDSRQFDTWSATQTWPQTIPARCPRQPGRSRTVTIKKPPPTAAWWEGLYG
ncbi:hypothetical protein ACFV9C_41795 [Kribbella sp. NPDC059898]|uniref:hypothetical protein n=1 Tax=Kribbella sp. NPDC059898 TaxID=3346995 RepID=UPI0036699B5F